MIVIAASIESIKTRRDKTVSVQIGTQELSPEKAGELFSAQNKLGFVAISLQQFSEAETEIIDNLDVSVEKADKTPAQRLRNTLYRVWESDKEGYKDFNLYYIAKMELLINHYKTKIA